MSKPAFAWVTLITLITLLLTACGGAPAPSAEAPAAEETDATTEATASIDAPDATTEAPAAAPRGTLRVAQPIFWGGAESLDPSSPVAFYDVMRPLYDTLVVYDENFAPAPALATSWEANDDATVWTFTLRDDVVFHDGKPFTSADVVYTFERVLAPDSASLLSSILSIIDTIETPDDTTVVFSLSQPHAELPVLFIPLLASIIPEGSGETIGETGIGTGPFQLEQLDATGTTRMVANDDYWRGEPGLAAIDFVGIADADARIQALQAGQIDLVFALLPQQAALLQNNANLVVQQFAGGKWAGLGMRTDTPPFDDVRVRQAMRLLVDRQQMLELVQQGTGTISCDTLVWPGDPHYWEGKCPSDSEQAKALLAEAGYPDGLDVTLYTSNNLPYMLPLAEVYQQQAAQAGITIELEQVAPDAYWTEIWGVEPFFVTGDVQYPADFILNLYYRAGSPYNVIHWDDAETAALLDTARATLDPVERNERYQEVLQYLASESGYIILFYRDEIQAFARNVHGVQPIIDTDLLWHGITKTEE
ncbi:MAG: ABC transporter substrate-binding protein [Chloroflexaceae bacterium]|nr:ABC transporter substrate-binding protein [Chloroflexaceae bacterium]